MAPFRGCGAKGKRLRGFAPHGHWRTLTFLGALRLDRLAAPCIFDGPMLPRLCRAAARSRAPARRHRRHGQSPVAQVGRHPAGDPRRRSLALGSCPHTPPTSIPSSRPSPRSITGCDPPKSEPSRDMATPWTPRRRHPAGRLRELLPQRRIRRCHNLNGSRTRQSAPGAVRAEIRLPTEWRVWGNRKQSWMTDLGSKAGRQLSADNGPGTGRVESAPVKTFAALRFTWLRAQNPLASDHL